MALRRTASLNIIAEITQPIDFDRDFAYNIILSKPFQLGGQNKCQIQKIDFSCSKIPI